MTQGVGINAAILLTISPWIFHKCTCNINSVCHDNVIKWTHLPRYWPFVRGIHRSPVDSTHRGQWRGALMFSLICARTRCFLWFAPEQKVEETIETAVIYYDVTVVVWPIYVNSLRAELYAAWMSYLWQSNPALYESFWRHIHSYIQYNYRQTSSISRTNSTNLNVSCLGFAQSTEGRY